MSNTAFAFDERLDVDFLNSIYEGDTEHAGMVFEEFLQKVPVQLAEIETSFNAGAVDEFRKKIHKVKPVFSFVGLTTCSSKAEAIEKMCERVTNINELRPLYEAFAAEINVFVPVIKTELQKLKS